MSYPYHQNVAPGSSYIAPQQLMMNHVHVPTVQSPQARRSGKTPDLATLLPGSGHLFTHQIQPTPGNIMAGMYSSTSSLQQEMMMIFPRRQEYCGPPSFPSITFSAQGKPGLYLRDLLKNKYDHSLDGARDPVFEHHAWKITKCLLEWPGVICDPWVIQCRDPQNRPITRLGLAKEVASRIAQMVTNAQKGLALPHRGRVVDSNQGQWSLGKVYYGDIRILALSYYHRVWVPIIAIDAS